MKDRVPLYPGRVTLTPVSGQANTYDMTRADQPTQQGDPLNKATLLKDATAALFGLGTDAVPDDVFAWIGEYNLHWWRRRKYTPKEILLDEESQITILESYEPSLSTNIKYSPDVMIEANGEVSLLNPSTLPVSYSSYTKANMLKGKYFENNVRLDTGLYYMRENAPNVTRKYISSKSKYYIYATAQKVKDAIPGFGSGEWEYLSSSNSSAHPNFGVHDGYEYEYIGVPFSNFQRLTRFVAGSYIGTGRSGEENPNSISADFTPQLVIVKSEAEDLSGGFVWIKNSPYGISGVSGGDITTFDTCRITWEENSVSWYAINGTQLNSANTLYHYCILG